jgi:hypothetical protein
MIPLEITKKKVTVQDRHSFAGGTAGARSLS